MKIGITGVSGVLGSEILNLLSNKTYSVTGFSRQKNHPLSFEVLDITSPSACFNQLINFDLIIHAAALVSFHKKHKKNLYETNVVGTKNVVDACIVNKIPNLIFISSTAVLDDTKNPIDENTLWNRSSFKTDYAKSKYEAELEIWRAKEEGINVATVCPGIIIGSGKTNKSSDQLYAVIKNKWNVYPIGANGFINAKEVAEIVIKIIELKAYDRRYLAVTHNCSYQFVLNSIAQKLNMPKPKYAISPLIISLVLPFIKFGEFIGLKMPFPSQGLINSSKNVTYNPQNIYFHLHYSNGELI